MARFIEAIEQFLKQEDGPTATEYAIMIGTIIAVVVLAVGSLGSATLGMLQGAAATIFGP